jgi:hypothetical protein
MGANELTNLLQQCEGAVAEFTFGNKFLGGRCKMWHCYKPWFDADCCIAKQVLKLWLKANHDSHAAKHIKKCLKIY